MIGLRHLLGYLVGHGPSIRKVARHRGALWIGLVFVIAAGFAREYDGEDLLHEPWHLAIPLVASLVTSFVLHALLWMFGSAAAEGADPEKADSAFLAGYPAFLRLYWWTAPLALLYAIPVERWTDPAGATQANLLLLGLVATWRVLLITRAVAVTWRAPFLAVWMPVMLFADALAFLLLMVAPLPVFTLMGGVRLSESEQVLRETATWIKFLCVVTGPIWLLGSSFASRWLRRAPLAPMAGKPVGTSASGRVSRPLLAAAALVLLVWIPILPATQPAQQRRRELEEALEAGRIEAAIEHVQGRSRDEFPLHWDPPPRPGYGETEPDPDRVLDAARSLGAPAWFLEAYEAKLEQMGRD